MKQLSVSAIKEGTVIDHIPSAVVFKVVDVLDLEHSTQTIMVASNLKSKRTKTKGIIKVSGKALSEEQLGKIAVIAPAATVNLINNYEVAKKLKLELPSEMINVIKCSNPKCITNNDAVHTKFHVSSKKPVKVRCHYCERYMDGADLEVL